MKKEKRFTKEPIKGKTGVYRVIDNSPPNGDALNLSEIDKILRRPVPKKKIIKT